MTVEHGAGARLEIWTVALQAAAKYGLIGSGLSNFPMVFDQFPAYSSVPLGDSRGAHSVWLGTLVELGVIGLGLLLGGVVSQLRGARAAPSAEERHWAMLAIESACIGVLVAGAFLDILWRKSFWLPWIFLAQTSERHRVRREHR
jgi:O-antigen ligase